MKSTTNDLSTWKQLTKNGPKRLFEIKRYLLNQWPYGKDIQNSLENSLIVLLLSARHQHKKQRNLFGMVVCPYKCIDCQQLAEWMTTEFKGTVHIPTFGTTQDIKLLVSGKE